MQNRFLFQKILQTIWTVTLFSVILESHIKPKKCHSHDSQGTLEETLLTFIHTILT